VHHSIDFFKLPT